MNNILFEPYKLNSNLAFQNRLGMAPLTRCFAKNGLPTLEMANYYARRASYGFIISEATMISRDASGYPNTPGIFLEEQIKAWKVVTQKVRDKGCKFFLQLWHAGMMSHRIYRNGEQPISASAVPPKNLVIPRTEGKLTYEVPKAMDRADMETLIKNSVQAAKNALLAGCDGIEIHGANGYLIDSFLHYYSNRRTDEYGGSPENMCRFVLEVVDAIGQAIGYERLGIRLSPVPVLGMDNVIEDSKDQNVFIYLLQQLSHKKIAYVHVSSDNDEKEYGQLGMPVSKFIRHHFKGCLIGCGGYTPETGAQAIHEGRFDLLSLGRLSIANPNVYDLIQSSQPLKVYEPSMLASLK